jgi:hypothetical protein
MLFELFNEKAKNNETMTVTNFIINIHVYILVFTFNLKMCLI